MSGNILNIEFSDDSGYKITIFNHSKPENVAIQLIDIVKQILSRI